MDDHYERFARLVLLCEGLKTGKYPTMNDVERVAVALLMNQTGWLRHKGCTVDSAMAFIGPAYAAVLDEVRRTVELT